MAKDLKYIRKKKNKYGNSFLVDIPYFDENNKQKHISKNIKIMDYGDEKTALAQAQKFRNEMLQQIRDRRIQMAYPTVRSLYERKWALIPLAANTRHKQDCIFRNVGDLADKTIDKVQISDIQLCLNEYAQTHSADQIQRFLSIWRSIYKCASLLGYDLKDLSEMVILPKSQKVTKKRNQSLDPEDFRRILERVGESRSTSRRDDVIWNLLLIMYYTGVRPAEALALTADDIHTNYISINKQVGSTASEMRQIVPVKTALSERKVPVPSGLRPILENLIRNSVHKYLLSDERGELYDITRISDRILDISTSLGVDFHAYMLRHLMSTELLQNGDSVVARDILGHSSFGMTLDYARSTENQRFEAIRDRDLPLVEKQSKNKYHEEPHSTLRKRYATLRVGLAVRLIIWKKQD